MAGDGSSRMRKTIIASALGGLVAVSACIAITGMTVEGMKSNAQAAMAQRVEQSAVVQDNHSTQQQQATSTSSSAASDAASMSSQSASSSASSESAASSASASDGASSAASDTASQSDAAAAPQASAESTVAPQTASTDGDVEVVGKGVYNGQNVYIIKWGDTLSYISAETGVSVDAIADANGIHDVDRIYADSALQIPGKN